MLVVYITNIIERQVAMWIIIDVRLEGVCREAKQVFFKQLVPLVGHSQLHLSFVVEDEVPLRVAHGLKRNSSANNMAMGVEQSSWVCKTNKQTNKQTNINKKAH